VFPDVEPELALAMRGVRTVTVKAIVRKDWADIAVELDLLWNRLGFNIYSAGLSASFFDERYAGIMVPWYSVALLMALGPLAWLFSAGRQRRRRRAGRCQRCGYDLRATPDRCPECGAAQRPPHNPPL